jgi:hypothetical protein
MIHWGMLARSWLNLEELTKAGEAFPVLELWNRV